MQCQLKIPLHLISEANTREHWAVKSNRKQILKWEVIYAWKEINPKIALPCTVLCVRIAPRKLDDDNLVAAFKTVRDQIAALIFPEKKFGRADDTDEITWEYAQEKGQYGIRIEIT